MARWLGAGAVLMLVLAAAGGYASAGEPGDELPEGPGKEVLRRACRSCHDLGEVTKFKGYFSRAQWHDVVDTMVAYGARVSPGEVELLADYLTEHLGRK